MVEQRKEVRTFAVNVICPACGIGIMQCDYSSVLASWPPLYTHRCPNCGWVEQYRVVYPKIEYQVIEPEEE